MKSRGENGKKESAKDIPKALECEMIWQNLHGVVVGNSKDFLFGSLNSLTELGKGWCERDRCESLELQPGFPGPKSQCHVLLQGVTRPKTFGVLQGRAVAVKNGFGTAASQREAASAVASAGIS